jgi:hypothetical protein
MGNGPDGFTAPANQTQKPKRKPAERRSPVAKLVRWCGRGEQATVPPMPIARTSPDVFDWKPSSTFVPRQENGGLS